MKMASAGAFAPSRTIMLVCLLTLSARAAAAPPATAMAGYDPQRNPVILWDKVLLRAVAEAQVGPTIASRALAIVHTCMYDAWAAYDDKAAGTRLGTAMRRPPQERTLANKGAAISHAAYACLSDLFPARAGYFATLLARSGHDPTNASENPASPAGIGNLAARAVIQFRHADGSNQLGDLARGAYSDTTGYRPANTPEVLADPDRWQPLLVPNGRGGVAAQQFLTPHWGDVRPFALRSGRQLRPAARPASLPESLLTGDRAFQEQARETLQYAASLTDEQKMIVEYWADGPRSESPPGHWCFFAHKISDRDQHSLDQDVKLFFLLSNAMLDTGIAVWDAKRAFDSVRPISAIQFLFRGKVVRAWGGPFVGSAEVPGETWTPYQQYISPSPPFPEFPSGHSAFSAAAAEILKRFTGSDVFGESVLLPAGSSLIEPGVTPESPVAMSWATFSDAADQAGMSRRYGGIHFREGDLVGRDLGRRAAAEVWQVAADYLSGRRAAERAGPATTARAFR